jgi:putative transposase
VKVIQAYRFALDPTSSQERALRSHAGAARFAWNWGLGRCTERYAAEGRWYSAVDLHKLWNAAKQAEPDLAWWDQNSKCVYQEAFRDLDRALKDFIKSRKGQRKGRRLGFPKFKKRGKCRDSFRLYGTLRCRGATVTLPRLGTMRTHESTRKLARRLEAGTARILSASVSRGAQRWFVSFTVEVERDVPEHHARPGSAIGIDLGVKTLLTGVDNAGNLVTVTGPKPLRVLLRRLRRADRAHSRKVPGSANRRKSAARLARIHARVANVRADALHKGHGNARCPVPDHCGRGPERGRDDPEPETGPRHLRPRIWDFYPSSKACSGCGAVKAKLALSERTYRCGHCGLALDRDVNAAINLRNLAASGAESLNACGGCVRPGPAGRRPLNQEPGTVHAGKTGTVPRQHGTAQCTDHH